MQSCSAVVNVSVKHKKNELENNRPTTSFADITTWTPDRLDNERPRKRLRRDDTRFTVQDDGSFVFADEVVLAHAELYLNLDEGLKLSGSTSDCSNYGKPYRVIPSISKSGDGRDHDLEIDSDNDDGGGISLRVRYSEAGVPILEQMKEWSWRIDNDHTTCTSLYTLRFSNSVPGLAQLEAWILYRKGISGAEAGPGTLTLQRDLLRALQLDLPLKMKEERSVSDFYDNVHVPATTVKVPDEIEGVDLTCQLYPFQQRAVMWLLRREKVAYEGGHLSSIAQQEAKAAPALFKCLRDATGRDVYFSEVQRMFLDQPLNYPDLYGGILCEEMGLGKTVELLALITLHRRIDTPQKSFESLVDTSLLKSGATLIISPPHILNQWKSEIARHAPHLRVLHYLGMQAMSRAKFEDMSDPRSLLDYDIVLTTYNVLAREIHYAEAPPSRNFRHAKKYEPRRSPLVQISWWRVCLDEAQMIEGGVSKAATVARLIPRINAFAVSGTPLKKDLDDLFGLILFLWYEPYCLSKKTWANVSKPLFRQIIGHIAMRHTKDIVRQELRIPEQKRVVLTMPFTAIEDQNYSQLVQQMCDECGVTPDGAPATHDVNFSAPAMVENMRSWLRRLRQTCLHPQVGGQNRRALGRKGGPLKTVNEVLDTMIEQNESSLRAEQRQVVLAQVRCTHVLANDKSNADRWPAALDAYKAALQQATEFVDVIRKELREERARNPPRASPGPSSTDASQSESEEKSEQNYRLVTLQKALRSALEVRHICAFFAGTAYYQLKVDESRTQPGTDEFHRLEKLETEYYDAAKQLRKEMLREWDESAHRSMRKVRTSGEQLKVPNIPALEDHGGIESRKYLATLDKLSDTLDNQAAFAQSIRARAIEYLLLDLVDQDDGKDTTGEEYEDSTKKQDELQIYVTVLATAAADRHLLLTGQVNFLVDHETKEAEKAARRGEGHAPELLLKLLEERRRLLPSPRPGETTGSLRDVVTQIRSTVTALQWSGGEDEGTRASKELAIVNKQLREAQQILTTQSKVVTELEKDLELFRSTMNQRNEFYRQLQIISDTVAPYKEELDEKLDLAALQKEAAEREKSEKKLAALTTKRRFLLHLQTESTSEEARICVICQGTFELGVLTVCGHQYCKDCIRAWWKAHRTCPVCKRHLNLVDFHDITYKPGEIRAQEEDNLATPPSPSAPNSASPKSFTQIYSDIHASTLKEIKEIDLEGSYGTKIDTIAKHILWIREHDPGAKSIIFSQYSEFLQVLGGALGHFKIGHSSFGDKDGVDRFKQDASVECLLLDAKSDSSGLNLINATHVFFCEPLVNTAIELQAIARVHRIGQQRKTTVYMYLISETVEESIYELSVSRRMAHIGQDKGKRSRSGTNTPKLEEVALEAANSLELQQAPVSTLLVKGKSGGEIVQQGDLWQCLFGKGRARREKVSGEMEGEVNRFLRAEAAESRMDVVHRSQDA